LPGLERHRPLEVAELETGDDARTVDRHVDRKARVEPEILAGDAMDDVGFGRSSCLRRAGTDEADGGRSDPSRTTHALPSALLLGAGMAP